MTSDELLTYFRQQIRDEAKPFLWLDEEVYSYMDDAQRMFTRLAGGIRDATSELCTLKWGAAKKFVEYDERILGIRYAELGSNNRALTILNIENEVEGSRPLNYDYGLIAWRSRLSDPDGVVNTLILGMDSGFIRLVPGSAAADQASLVITREPLVAITTDGQEFEIATRHHTSLYYWMAHKAYNKQDVDTYDAQKSKDFERQFRDYCEWTRRTDVNQREHKVRSTAYGGL